jgi:glycosyltransferase involved in cell wall biosynthesis
MTKVAFVVTKSEFGGAQEYLRILMSSMRQYESVLISGDTGFLTETAARLNVTYRICDGLVHPVHPTQDVKAIWNMYALLCREKPDLVHANSSKAGVVARVAARLAGIPVVFTAHGWAFTDGVSSRHAQVYRWIEKGMAPLARKIICVSHYDEKLAAESGITQGADTLTVHNGIPDVPDCVTTHTNSVPCIVMVARFCAQKDHETLLRAVHLLKDCQFTLRCVGDGPLLEQCRKLTATLGIQDKVEFLGARSDVRDILRNADIFTLVSTWEGFPLSILEGMRAGLPVVATRIGGTPESVKDEVTGLLVPPKSPVALADALRRLIAQPDLRKSMGNAGRERYLRQFTAEHMVLKTAEVYASALTHTKHHSQSVFKPDRH